jgi:hydroxymethylglutaryl-CoA lyase
VIRIIEVGPRDGLQNEKIPIPTEAKAAFIHRLVKAGLREIEATSFVSPKWVPQLGDAEALWPMIYGAKFSALVPNARGMERAIGLGVERIALFTAASDAFTQKNINMTVDESLDVFRALVSEFRAAQPNGWVRGYVSTVFECPYSGPVAPKQVRRVSAALLEMGVDEISLGDTIGVGTPNDVRGLHEHLSSLAPLEKFAWHFHDTRGTAIANVSAALDLGYRAFDASAAGLGGCPYAPGAGGNLATDDLIYLLEASGFATGVDKVKLAQASLPVLEALGRIPASKAQVAELSRCMPTG